MKPKKNNQKFSLWEVITVIIVTSVISILATGLIVYKNQKIDYNALTKDKHLKEFISAYSSVINNYYQDVDKPGIINAAIDAMFNYLQDPYTSYLNEEDTVSLAEKLAGEYDGIGVEVANDSEGIIILGVFAGSPAEQAGIKVGDHIVSINNQAIGKKTVKEAVSIIKESSAKEFTIGLSRNNISLTVTIKKDKLYIPSVNSRVINLRGQNIAYIDIAIFSSTTANQVSSSLNKFDTTIKYLILDLRNNTGGYLSAASNIAELFLPDGKIIYSLKTKKETTTYKTTSKNSTNFQIYVLINENTASAAEVLAAALKDSYNAVIVGKKSYGKGKVQQTITLEDGRLGKYTSALWLRPNGDCIDKVGINPDYEIDFDATKYNQDGTDTQLNKALSLIK